MAVNEDVAGLLELIACPLCRGAIVSSFAGVECTGCGRIFELDGRVPVMVRDDDAGAPSSYIARAQYALLGNPRVYDLQQRHGGAGHIAGRVKEALADLEGKTLLDIGAGRGWSALCSHRARATCGSTTTG